MRSILAKKMYNANPIFRQFSEVKNGGRSQQPRILCQLVTSESQRTGISCPKKS